MEKKHIKEVYREIIKGKEIYKEKKNSKKRYKQRGYIY